MKEVIIALAIVLVLAAITCVALYWLTGYVSSIDATAALLFCGVIVGSSKARRDG